VIKPDVVEYGGDFAKDAGVPPNFTCPEDVCPELIRSTLYGGPAVGRDDVGTSYAAPKVTHIIARLAAAYPHSSCLLYRALVAQSARWPEWITAKGINSVDVLRHIGYGIPDAERALGNSPNRITLATVEDQYIKARRVRVYQVRMPEDILSQGVDLIVRVEITLSYKAEPRRTRRQKRKYLSTWLDWDCSKRGEDLESFLARVLADHPASSDAEKGEELFEWTLGKQKNHGKVRDVSRGAGTLQKDWAFVKSFELREAFCIAVVGHEGWNNNPEDEVPFVMAVSFEAVETNVPIYAQFVEAQVPIEIETEASVANF